MLKISLRLVVALDRRAKYLIAELHQRLFIFQLPFLRAVSRERAARNRGELTPRQARVTVYGIHI